jgi:hypothetical protein
MRFCPLEPLEVELVLRAARRPLRGDQIVETQQSDLDAAVAQEPSSAGDLAGAE